MYTITLVGRDSLFLRYGVNATKEMSSEEVTQAEHDAKGCFISNPILKILEEMEDMINNGLTGIINKSHISHPKELHVALYTLDDFAYCEYLLDYLMEAVDTEGRGIYTVFYDTKIILHCSSKVSCNLTLETLKNRRYYKPELLVFDNREVFTLKAPGRNDKYNTYNLSEDGVSIKSVDYGTNLNDL